MESDKQKRIKTERKEVFETKKEDETESEIDSESETETESGSETEDVVRNEKDQDYLHGSTISWNPQKAGVS
jgi:hypothetical protein